LIGTCQNLFHQPSLSANAITNASLTQILSNTAFNSTAEQIGVLVATDETTLDQAPTPEGGVAVVPVIHSALLNMLFPGD
jgi:hypothetical protein